MTIGSMETPKTREEFEYRFQLLGYLIKNNKIVFSPNVKHSIEGLKQLRYLPNGRIDFLSVDESTRLIANMYATMPHDDFSIPNQDTDES